MNRATRLGLTTLQVAFIEGWDGDAATTAARVGITPQQAASWQGQDWFIDGIRRRTDREVNLAKADRRAKLHSVVLDRVQLQEFWSSVVVDDSQTMRDRLGASKHLADSLGAFTQKIEITGDESKPVCVKSVDLEERIKQLATTGVKVHLDFLE